MTYDIFISYNKRDYPVVETIIRVLAENGYTFFIDREGIFSGDSFASRIADAVRGSSLILFISSVNSNRSHWVSKEIAFAISLNKIVIPIRIDNSDYSSEIRFDLLNYHYIDLIGHTDASLIKKNLLAAIRRVINNDLRTTTEPDAQSSNIIEQKDNLENYVPQKNQVDIFISYRRIDGRDYARSIMQGLKIIGYPHVFFDFNSLRDGVFNTQIIDSIYSCNDFLLVISPLALRNCSREGDWVAREIRLALKYQKKIIPIVIEDTFKDWPEDFPSDLLSIKGIQFHKLKVDEYFESSIDMLAKRLRTEASNDSTSLFELQNDTLINQTNFNTVMYKIKVDRDCRLLIDEEEIQLLKASKLAKIPLPRGEYIRKVIDINDENTFNETTISLSHDKVDIITFKEPNKNSLKTFLMRHLFNTNK